jgi:hypothetical protein
MASRDGGDFYFAERMSARHSTVSLLSRVPSPSDDDDSVWSEGTPVSASDPSEDGDPDATPQPSASHEDLQALSRRRGTGLCGSAESSEASLLQALDTSLSHNAALTAELSEAHDRMAQMQAVCAQADECLADNARALAVAVARAEEADRRAARTGGDAEQAEEVAELQAALGAAVQRVATLEGRAKAAAGQVVQLREAVQLAEARVLEAHSEAATWKAGAQAAERDCAAARAEAAASAQRCEQAEAQVGTLDAQLDALRRSCGKGDRQSGLQAAVVRRSPALPLPAWMIYAMHLLVPRRLLLTPKESSASAVPEQAAGRTPLDGPPAAELAKSSTSEPDHQALLHQIAVLTSRGEEAHARAVTAEKALHAARASLCAAREGSALRDGAATAALRDAQALILQLKAEVEKLRRECEQLRDRCQGAEDQAVESDKELRALLAAAQDALGEAQRRVDAASSEAEAHRRQAAAWRQEVATWRALADKETPSPMRTPQQQSASRSGRSASPPRTPPHPLPWALTLRGSGGPGDVVAPAPVVQRTASPVRYGSPSRGRVWK